MLNDRQASELVSKSLAGQLSTAESHQIDEHLAASPQSRAFERISRLIQESLADIAVMTDDGNDTVAPGLSTAAKQRLKDSIRRASSRMERRPTIVDQINPDTALAMILLEQRLIEEEQLADLIQAWRPTQAGSLGDYLITCDILTESKLAELDEQVAVQMTQLNQSQSSSVDIGAKLNESAVLSRIDEVSNSAAPKAADEAPGVEMRQVVSRFKLIKKLGDGGLGSVWLARDEKIKRTVAIKEMSPGAAESNQAWLRFHREAEITGSLEHPNVVPLYQFGSDPKTGQPFYAMRFVGKRTLADAIVEYHERRKADIDVAIDLRRLLTAFLGVCQAIAYAHSRGVIHRDLKPENVALDSFGQVIVLDWGLAKLTDESELALNVDLGSPSDEGYLARTKAGEVVGTPLYMAPEQASGDLTNVDERTDVYGLGAILFAILTGCAPHEGSHSEDGQPRHIADILESIANSEASAPRDYNPSIPADLEAICVRAIARNRFARHSSAAELAEEVERWMAGQTEKQQKYDSMRMEGREVRATLQSAISDLSTNVRFMANLPPIQEIIDLKSGVSNEEESAWRERLVVIYAGLLRANLDYSAIGFCQVLDDGCHEIVRVERHSTDTGNVRSVPLSRLAVGRIEEFEKRVMEQKPDEVFMTLVEEAESDQFPEGRRPVRAGVPLFDSRTEDPFGFVWIECDLQKIVGTELHNRVRTAQQVLFVDHNSKVWIHDTRGIGVIEDSIGKAASELSESAPAIIQHLQDHSECVCEVDRRYYAARIDLGRRNVALYLLLSLGSYEDDEGF